MTKNEYINGIKRLKEEKNAIILAHYYQNDEIQEIADYVGDSLALAQIAKNTKADILVVCGVHFMAETAKILSLDKKVLLPVKHAGCFMADCITPEQLKAYKKKNPDTMIITYVNSSAAVKALSDVCVTSSNAVDILKYYAGQKKKMLYCPDKNLGKYVLSKNPMDLDLWDGYCNIHQDITYQQYELVKFENPQSLFIAHPECNFDVLQYADYVGSTKQMIEFVSSSNSNSFIVATEIGVLYEMKKRNPTKKFIPFHKEMKCKDMKLITIEDVYQSLSLENYEIKLDKDTALLAKKSLDTMLELSRMLEDSKVDNKNI